MKARTILSLGVALVLSAYARADAPTSAVMGQLDAILAYCAKINPSAQSQYNKVRLAITRGLSGTERHAIADTQEYRTAYGTAIYSLERMPLSRGLKACGGSAKGGHG